MDSTAWVGTSRIVTVPTHCLSSSNGAAMSRPSGRPCPPVAASLCGDAPDWGAVRTVAGEMGLADSRWGEGPGWGKGLSAEPCAEETEGERHGLAPI